MTDFTYSPYDRDVAIRTILGEAGNQGDAGMAAVANVLKNRVQAGFAPSVSDVAFQKGQFEPWMTQASATRLQNISPDSAQYKRTGQIVDAVFSGGGNVDNTNGATHFFAPVAQSALGRNDPSWASTFTPTAQIGGHNFYQDPQFKASLGEPKAFNFDPNGQTPKVVNASFPQSADDQFTGMVAGQPTGSTPAAPAAAPATDSAKPANGGFLTNLFNGQDAGDAFKNSSGGLLSGAFGPGNSVSIPGMGDLPLSGGGDQLKMAQNAASLADKSTDATPSSFTSSATGKKVDLNQLLSVLQNRQSLGTA